MKKNNFLCLALAGCSICACMQEKWIPEENPGTQTEESIEVKFTIDVPEVEPGVKSVVTNVDESVIHDLLLMAYHEGQLIDYKFIREPLEHLEELSLDLQQNTSPHLYAAANGFPDTPPADEASMLKTLGRQFNSIRELDKGLPMCWTMELARITGEQIAPISIDLRRLAAKVVLGMDCAGMAGFHCDGVALRQIPKVIFPFRSPEGCRAADADEVMDGDQADAAEGTKLVQGDKLVFYTLENRQGKLIRENSDPWKKIPDEMNGGQDRSTYIEIHGHFEAPSIHRGEVTLRFYLGRNAWNDFNVDGNSVIYLNIIGSDNNLDKVSWKVESHTSLNPDGCKAWISADSMHQDGTLYVGEYFKIEFSLDPELEKYLTQKEPYLQACFFTDDQAEVSSPQSPIFFNGIERHPFRFLGRCVSTGSGSIWLCNRNGIKILPLLKKIQVMEPIMTSSLDENPYCNINEPLTIKLTARDREGRDLSKNPLGFASYLFRFSMDTDHLPSGYFYTEETGQAWTWNLKCDNTGTDHERNRQLNEWINKDESFKLTVNESQRKSKSDFFFKLSHGKILLTYLFMPDSYKMTVSNSSKIPLEIVNHITFMTTDLSRDNLGVRDKIIGEVESSLAKQTRFLLLKTYDEVANCLYSSNSRISAGKEEYCTPHTDNGYTWEYLVKDNAPRNAAIMALYNYKEPGYSKLLVDVTMMGHRIQRNKISVKTKSTSGYGIVAGYRLYSGKEFYKMEGNYILEFLNPLRINEIYDSPEVCKMEFFWDQTQQGLLVKSLEMSSGIPVDIRLGGYVISKCEVMEGNQLVTKNHYENFDHEIKDVVLSDSGSAIDGNTISEAFKRSCAASFEDHRPEGITSVHAQPERIVCNIYCKLSDAAPETVYTTKMICMPGRFVYHHAEDGQTYTLEDETRIHLTEYTNVTRKM